MPLNTLFFDLDDTLYPASSGLWSAIRARIELYLRERLGIPAEQVPELRRSLFQTYGTTLRGLQFTRQVDTLDYLAFVHDLPLADYLAPDAAERAMLLALPQHKFIFTNGDSLHAARVLKALQLEDCFEGIIDVHAIAPYCKPQEEAFRIALEKAGEQDPARCLLLDDAPRNLATARKLGFFTVLIGQDRPCPEWDACIPSLLDLPSVLPDRCQPASEGVAHA